MQIYIRCIKLQFVLRLPMPRLSSTDKHGCLLCKIPFHKRSKLKDHLTKPTKDGKPRCKTLKKVLSTKIWNEKILPYFKDDVELPELPSYIVKSPGGRRTRKQIDKLTRKIVKRKDIPADIQYLLAKE